MSKNIAIRLYLSDGSIFENVIHGKTLTAEMIHSMTDEQKYEQLLLLKANARFMIDEMFVKISQGDYKHA